MLSAQEIDTIQHMYKRLGTIRSVQRNLGYSLSTVHKYVRKKFPNDNIQPKTALISKNELLIGTYVGIWMGDGTQYMDSGSYTIKICSSKKNTALNKFIVQLILLLFNKKAHYNADPIKNDLYIRMRSKFIYHFIYEFTAQEKNKTKTIRLKNELCEYSDNFLLGILLGLTLSDGYIKKSLIFRTTSERLAKNYADILRKYNFNPTLTKKARNELNWSDIVTVRLGTKETETIISVFNHAIKTNVSSKMCINQLKYG